MAQARAAARLCGRAVVSGVAFFDFKHGQTGVAPNAIELHPILGFSLPVDAEPTTTAASKTTAASSTRLRGVIPGRVHPPPPPDLNCADILYRNFRMLWNVPDPDPHHFDGNHNGIGL